MTLPDVELTSEQEELIEKLVHWFHFESIDKPYYSYTAKAGCGKTFIIPYFVERMGLTKEEYICGAYVGKAVLNLIKKGLRAKTIHSIIYNIRTVTDKYEDDDGYEFRKQRMNITLKDHLDDPNIKLMVFDEATMINDKMKEDILSFGIPCIFIGDMNQLPPIFGISTVMMRPDFALHKIMRQEEGDPIVQLADQVLAGMQLYEGQYGETKVVYEIEMERNLIDDYDQIICCRNKTRDDINKHVRSAIFGRHTKLPLIGDKLVCRQNDWTTLINEDIYLTNGLIGYVVDIDRSRATTHYMTISFQPDFLPTDCFDDIKLDMDYFVLPAQARADFGVSAYNKFEFAYAITCHTSQGSTIERVLYFDEPLRDPDMTRKLRYTAITRASKYVHIVIPRPYPTKRFYMY